MEALDRSATWREAFQLLLKSGAQVGPAVLATDAPLSGRSELVNRDCPQLVRRIAVQ